MTRPGLFLTRPSLCPDPKCNGRGRRKHSLYGKMTAATRYHLETVVPKAARKPNMLEDELLKWKLRRDSVAAIARL